MKKKMKKLVAIFMAGCVSLALLCTPAFALTHESTYNGVYYSANTTLNPSSGSTTLGYGVNATLKVSGSAIERTTGSARTTPYSKTVKNSMRCYKYFSSANEFIYKSATTTSYINGTRVDTMTVTQ